MATTTTTTAAASNITASNNHDLSRCFHLDVTIEPCLLHGDLWSGNISSDKNGEPVILDPACYYGHNEAEFGMSWCAGFGGSFYNAYFEVMPKQSGFEKIRDLYLLYLFVYLVAFNVQGRDCGKQVYLGGFDTAHASARLGFLIDFLSHAAIVGFIGGAAVTIALQQLKGLFGIKKFTKKTDVISVMRSVVNSVEHGWNYQTILIGVSFLVFLLVAKYIGKKNKKLFWVPAIAPLISVIVATFCVFITHAERDGVQIEDVMSQWEMLRLKKWRRPSVVDVWFLKLNIF